MPAIQAPTGTRDILPIEWARWEWLYGVHARQAELFGYRPIVTPVFEATEMFERGIGAGTDVVDKEMYSFETSGGTRLTLRPEGTPATLRAVLSAHLDQERHPVRVHYAGPMFRHDKPQRGRYRQFHQVGIEAIGERNPALDAEVIEVGWRFYAALGITGVSLQVNTIGDIEDRQRYRQQLIDYYTPHRDELCADCQRRFDINPLRLLDCRRDVALVADAPVLLDSISQESRDYFDQVLTLLAEAGIAHSINSRLVRGLDYYAHTAFEFWHTSLHGAQNALGGGGRYDGLAEVLGFPATPGVGYALGVERALLVLEDSDQQAVATADADVVVCPVGHAALAIAADIARSLRRASHTTVLDAADKKLEKKIRNADRLGARVCVILGDDELAAGTANVRDLERRQQEPVEVSAIESAVAAILARARGEG